MTGLDRLPLVAVVDDDAQQRRILREVLMSADYAVVEAENGHGAIELSRTHPLDALLLDVCMPELNGLEALATIKQEHPQLVVILLTAFIDVRDAVAAIKNGAHDYLEKPVDLDELIVAVDEALNRERVEMKGTFEPELELPPGLVAESPAMRRVLHEALRVAPTEAPVLILGESGTGKEVVARFIHEHSLRRRAPFGAVNCAALPENMLESELFGHARGAFTGAVQAKPGRFEEASGSTLLLDEIGEMPLILQPKLLRVLEEHTLRRLGGTRDIQVDPRIVAATNRSLENEVREGRFREDLFYRINLFTLSLPLLRERRDDILPLADHFLQTQGMREKRFSPAVQHALMEYSWPGNVRELRNAVIRAAIIARGALILPDDLPESMRTGETPAETVCTGGLTDDMEAIQKKAILNALQQTGGNKTHAANLLGISRRNLIYKLRSYGM